MSRYRVEIRITPRPGLLDPQGQAIHHALQNLGFSGVESVRVGKAIYLELEADTPEEAAETADDMCGKLLANPVTEDFRIRVQDQDHGDAPGDDDAGDAPGREGV